MAQNCLNTEESCLSPNPNDSGFPPDFLDSDPFDEIGPNFSGEFHELLDLKSSAEGLNSNGKNDVRPSTVMAIIVPNGFPIIEERMETLIMDTLNSEDQGGPL